MFKDVKEDMNMMGKKNGIYFFKNPMEFKQKENKTLNI